MNKFDRKAILLTTTRDIIKNNPSGDYCPNFITKEELNKLVMPKDKRRKNG